MILIYKLPDDWVYFVKLSKNLTFYLEPNLI